MRGAVMSVLMAGLRLAEFQPRSVDTPCGFSLLLPAGWRLQTTEQLRRDECSIGLIPPEWQRIRQDSELEVHDAAISITQYKGDVQSLCSRFSVCRDNAGWYAGGRVGSGSRSRLRATKTGPHLVIDGEVEVGAYYKDRGYGSMATVPIIILVSGNRVVHAVPDLAFVLDPKAEPWLETEGEKLFSAIVRSVRLKVSNRGHS